MQYQELPLQSAAQDTAKTFRILILGLPGSGKTTLAQSLSTKLKIRHIECDKHIHENNFVDIIAQEIKPNGFIIEGRFKDLKNLFMQQEWTHIIWLDPNLATLIWRLLKREIQIKGLRKTFSSQGTFRFFLKNHKRLRHMQKEAFTFFQQNGKIQTQQI